MFNNSYALRPAFAPELAVTLASPEL
jgi:hypothetical protein